MVESSAVNSNFQYGVISEHKDEEIKKYSAWEEKTAVQIRFTIGGLALGKFIAQNDKVTYILQGTVVKRSKDNSYIHNI